MEPSSENYLVSNSKILQSDASSEENQYHSYNDNLTDFDITFPHEMNLKQFDFKHDEETSLDDRTLNLEFIKQTELFEPLENQCSPVNFFKKIDTFYEEMMTKLKLLKNTPVIKNDLGATKSSQESIISVKNKKLFKFLKNTPEVHEKLKFIQELDDEIKSIISDYKNAKEERLQTQMELCNDICKNNAISEKNTQSFLDMCHFEFSDPGEDDLIENLASEDIEKIAQNSVKATKKFSISNYPNNLIKRNIELAKTGALASSSLTDEEKCRIELLLETDEANLNADSSENLTEPSTSDVDTVSSTTLNAYSLLEVDKAKLVDIDEELEKFIGDEMKNEKSSISSSNFNDEFVLKQALKRINEHIQELRTKDEDLKLLNSHDIHDMKKDEEGFEDEGVRILEGEEFDEIDQQIESYDYEKYLDSDNDLEENQNSGKEENWQENKLEEGVSEISLENEFSEETG